MKKIQQICLKPLLQAGCVVAIALGTVSLWHKAEATNSKKSADFVRWDIVSVDPPPPPPAGSFARPGGEAFAFAYFTPGNPSDAGIRLTGAGTFVSPAGGGGSSAVTGGGTWETFDGVVSTGSGTYRVTRLVSWEFANFATDVGLIDEIADVSTAANGNAVLLIRYDDGSEGILGIGCHGPGSPDGILEGVIASKGFVTYWDGQLPAPNVDANRTVFHVLR